MAGRRKKVEVQKIDVKSAVNPPSIANHLFNNDMDQKATIALSDIKDRSVNTRPTNDEHVRSLSESIAVLGLIEPIVVDEKGCLLAGAHRLAAVRLLKEENLDTYEQHFLDDAIPVRIMPFDAEKDPNKALQCEVAENEHRRDYTKQEVCELAERLKKAGYLTKRGRRKKGEMHLVPALQVIVGKSRPTLMRYLAGNDNKSNVSIETFGKQQKAVKKLQKDLNVVAKLGLEGIETPKVQALNKQFPKFMKLIDAALEELSKKGR